jgi:hypothetical protein
MGIPIRGLLHDLSKLLPSEFIPYARYFYGTWMEESEWHGDKRNYVPWERTEMGISEAFDLAWLKHQKRNPHHWQYWLLQCDSGELKALDIPLKYQKEMLADWIGAGIAITGKREVKEWYAKNRDNIILHPSTRVWIDCEVDKCK